MYARIELFVNDIARSVAFYRDILQFVEDPATHRLSRGQANIGIGAIQELSSGHYFRPDITSGRKGVGVELVLEVDDIQTEYDRVLKTGYPIAETLQKRPWGLTDFRLVDPDGYYVRITSRT